LSPPTFGLPSEDCESPIIAAPQAAGHSFSNLSVVQPHAKLAEDESRVHSEGTDARQALQAGLIQAKLAISQPSDPLEEEADRVADQVMRTPDRIVQRQCSDHSPNVAPTLSSSMGSLHGGGGQRLPESTRGFFERRFGQDFSGVRLHADEQAAESAKAIDAKAFTVGQEIVFGAGEFALGTSAGSRLLAHELVHVIQQGKTIPGQTVVQRQAAISSPPAQKGDQQPGPPATPDASSGSLTSGIKVKLPPAPKGVLVRHTGTGLTFTDEPDYVRFQLEEYVNKNGLDSIKRFEGGDSVFILGGDPVNLDSKSNPPPDDDGAYLKRVVKTVHDEVITLRAHLSTFRDDFQYLANHNLGTVLQESKSRIEKELEKYGIKESKTNVLGLTVWTSYSNSDPVGTKKLSDDAKGLQSKLGQVLTAKMELDQVSKTTTQDDYRYRQAIWEGPHNKYEAVLKEYNDLRKNLENAHPMVMAYNLDPSNPATQGHLAKLASESGTDRAEHLGEELTTRLKNIEKVQTKASNDKNYVWSLDRIVGLTRQSPEIKNHRFLTHPGLQSSVVIEKVGDIEAADALVAIGAGIVLFGLGLIAAAPTGGLSLAGAATVSAAGVADAVLTIATAYNALQKYELDSAANATDYDTAKVISSEAPNLFWLALDLVGALRAVKSGLKSASSLFQQINRLREEALTLKAASLAAEAENISGPKQQYEKALADLENIGKDIKPDLGKKLREEVVNAKDPDPRGARASGGGGSDIDPPTLRNVGQPPGTATLRGTDGFPLSRNTAFEEYYRGIQANPGREYAVCQHRRTGAFAVSYGDSQIVLSPEKGIYGNPLFTANEEWSFVRHYHPNFNPKTGAVEAKFTNFKARIPSVKDLQGASGASLEKGGVHVTETLDWFNPETNKMDVTRYGYTPGAAQPYWIDYLNSADSSRVLKRFAEVPEFTEWWKTITWLGPLPQR